MWNKKMTKMQADQNSLFDINKSLKDDNKELMMQVDKYIKKVQEMDERIEAEKEKQFKTSMEVHDAKREVQSLQD